MEENSNTQLSKQLEQLVPKENAMSIIWAHSGFSEEETDQKHVNTINLFQQTHN